jgi:hypothetical protein
MTITDISLATWFCIAFGVMLLTATIMLRLSKQLYTNYVVERKFNILDLQFPTKPLEMQTLIRGIYQLREQDPVKVLKALKAQMYIDFLFMPAAYGCLAILCYSISKRLDSPGSYFMEALAWLQVVALMADVYENTYLLNKIRPNVVITSNAAYTLYKRAVAIKWCIALLAAVCGTAIVFYFWITGQYSSRFLIYAGILIAEIVLIFLLRKILT